MNSYPHEFLAHPAPLMFVAGLTSSKRERSVSQAASATLDVPASAASSPVSSAGRPRSESQAIAAKLESPSTHAEGALTTPVASPQPGHRELPMSPTRPDDEPPAGPGSVATDEEHEDEFETLTRNLRQSLEGLGRRNKVWLRESERRNFRVMLVDKGIRLPPRKVSPSTSGTQSPSSTAAHSPLSPLTTSSPLYPDGLMAPIWVKKHVEMVPAVFVMFLRLYEPPSRSSDDAADEAAAQARREADKAMEKDADEGLVREIAERRRRLGERGIKLTVVLMASATALDSPSLDARLSYLRRASQLSSKASLFVLSPVPADQLPEFVQSLQDALYEPAMEYYNQHAKHVKRKRSRLPASGSSTPTGTQGHGQGKALTPQGWIVRYEWKAGWFAEIRGELEEARRHFEDCWNELARMFASTQTLPPRTKRWAEAKVLADCVAMRICRLLLYADEGSKVLGPFFIHLKRFGDYSRGWGIGEDTFEFWSWIARQYRIFAELLEVGVEAGMQIPRISAPIFPTAQSAVVPPSLEDLATPISASNPLHILQTPAFYFYTAALCSVQRQQRFQDALAVEQESLEASVAAGYSATISPGYDNEKKVDHSALIIELYTKAYSLFKEQESAQNRTALYVAYRIAETYCAADQHELAMRFFERISQTFKRDKWSPIVRQIRELWYTCAQKTGNVEHAVRLLLEMMCPDSGVEFEDRKTLQDDLVSLMKTTAPSSEEPITIDMPADASLSTSVFWQKDTFIGSQAPFQVCLACPESTFVDNLHFESATVVFGGTSERSDLVIRPSAPSSSVSEVELRLIDVGDVTENAGESVNAKDAFALSSGQRLLIHGRLSSERPGEVSIEMVRLRLSQGSWKLDICLPVRAVPSWITDKGHLTVTPSDHISFSPRPFDVKLDVTAPNTVFVGETIPITAVFTNEDDRDVRVAMLPFLEGSNEQDDTTLHLVDPPEKGMNGYDCGVLPAGGQTTRTLNLVAKQIGDKRVDITTRIMAVAGTADLQAVGGDEQTPNGTTSADLQLEESVDIATVSPFTFTPHVSYGPIKRSSEGDRCGVAVTATIAATSQGDIQVDSLKLLNDDISHARLLWSSLDQVPYTSHTEPGVPLVEAIGARFELSGPADRVSLEEATAVSTAHVEVRWRSQSKLDFTTTRFALPPLSLPTQNAFVSARISHPALVSNQQPFQLSLVVDNSHPTQVMSGLVMQVDMSDHFVWHGERTTRLAPVPPDGTVQVDVTLVPVVQRAGTWELPRVRVYHPQRMQVEREEIRVDGAGQVDVRP